MCCSRRGPKSHSMRAVEMLEGVLWSRGGQQVIIGSSVGGRKTKDVCVFYLHQARRIRLVPLNQWRACRGCRSFRSHVRGAVLIRGRRGVLPRRIGLEREVSWGGAGEPRGVGLNGGDISIVIAESHPAEDKSKSHASTGRGPRFISVSTTWTRATRNWPTRGWRSSRRRQLIGVRVGSSCETRTGT